MIQLYSLTLDQHIIVSTPPSPASKCLLFTLLKSPHRHSHGDRLFVRFEDSVELWGRVYESSFLKTLWAFSSVCILAFPEYYSKKRNGGRKRKNLSIMHVCKHFYVQMSPGFIMFKMKPPFNSCSKFACFMQQHSLVFLHFL